ncbi:MAG TPA: NAD-dependent epimerase/dehydratase family protein, partial [Solirubrobacteraceae bacterium]|nr:NAD-dependent epimerase/dehydratase family protein [Solirubrobacteraceae bacterium]
MDIAVPGGTGMLGRPLVAELVRRGHDVRVLTHTPPRHPQGPARHDVVDVATGAGLCEALD